MSESKGLFSMFGGSGPRPVMPTFTKAVDIKTKEELAAEAAKAATEKSEGGGAWKTAKKRGSRGLALKARALGKSVVVSENKKVIPDFEEEDVSMGGMGKKKKR